MPHRFTALVLAFIIGGPLCCCGWMHEPEAVAQEQHEESCCHQQKEESHGQPAKDKDCMCARTPKVRALVQTDVAVPNQAMGSLPPLVWAPPMVLLPEERREFAALLPSEHGPPRRVPPLYLSHHSWLI